MIGVPDMIPLSEGWTILQVTSGYGHRAVFARRLPDGEVGLLVKSVICWALIEENGIIEPSQSRRRAVAGMVLMGHPAFAADNEDFLTFLEPHGRVDDAELELLARAKDHFKEEEEALRRRYRERQPTGEGEGRA